MSHNERNQRGCPRIMKWQQVRQHHPDRWLLVEATHAHTEADQRILDDLVVLDTYEDSAVAMSDYTQMHRQRPDRELDLLHTSREELKVEERRWFGIRAGACSCASTADCRSSPSRSARGRLH